MSNKKRTENISTDKDSQPINLSGESFPKRKKKRHLPTFKKPAGFNQIRDIRKPGSSPINNKEGLILRVKPSKTYNALGNILKIVVAGVIILLLVNSVNVYLKGIEIKDSISYSASQGFSKLLEGSKSTTKVQFTEARESFENALENFEDAEETLWFIATDDTIYAHESSLASSAKAILNSGKYFSKAGEFFTEALEELNKIPLYVISKNEEGGEFETQAQVDVTDFLKTGIDKASLALVETRAASLELEKINEDLLPPELKGRFDYAKEKISQIIKTLESIEEHFPAILKLLGEKHQHRYLILLQNNAETRPTGGFIGSYAIVDVNDGLIENVKVEDVYHLDDLYTELVPAPKYLSKYSPNFLFRNSNYSPDFALSGKNAAWMLQKEGGPSVDTVIAINQSLLEEFLEITGPLQVGSLEGEFTSENYMSVLTYIVEGKIWGKEDPKHILKVMVPEFQKALLKKENVSRIMSVLYKAAQQKMVMAYSGDSVIQSLFETLGIAGRVPTPVEDEDYLSVIQVSMGGTKTEPLIEQKITHDTQLKPNGEIIDTVTVTRHHTFSRDTQAEWNKHWNEFGFKSSDIPGFIVDMLGRAADKVNTRVIVPEGSQLLEVQGTTEDQVEVGYDEDLDRTYFLTEMRVLPGNEVSVTFKYKLPYKLDLDPLDTYKLTIQKQPGTNNSLFTKTLQLRAGGDSPDDDSDLSDAHSLALYTYYPEEAFLAADDQISYATNLVYDRYFSVVVGE
jgi:tetratricopeptide (TPR) repeat protein